MRITKLKLHLLLFLVIVLLTPPSSTSANYGTFCFDYKPTFSITNIAYLVDSSASGYTNSIEAAFKSWKDETKNNDVKARVGYYKVSNSPYYTPPVQVVFRVSNTGKSYTAFFTSSGDYANIGTGEPYTNWSKCVIYLVPGMSPSKAKSTAIHELGHVFSLKHPSIELPSGIYQGDPSCMLPSDEPTYPNSIRTEPTTFDVENLNDRFK